MVRKVGKSGSCSWFISGPLGYPQWGNVPTLEVSDRTSGGVIEVATICALGGSGYSGTKVLSLYLDEAATKGRIIELGWHIY